MSKRMKAISPIIAILLIVAITVAAAVITYLYVSGSLKRWYTTPGMARGSIMIENAVVGVRLDRNGLLGYWKLDGNYDEASGSGAKATPSGDPTFVQGVSGQAVHLDGVDDYVQLSDFTAPTQYTTVEFWMYWEGGNSEMPFGWNNPYDLWLVSDNFGFNTGGGDVYGISGANNFANKWVHVVAVFPNNYPAVEPKLYINGELQSLSLLQGTRNTRNVTLPGYLGRWGVNTAYMFGGSIDEVAIYDGEISEFRVKEHYENKGPYLSVITVSVRNTGSTKLKILDVYVESPSGIKEHISRDNLMFSGDGVLEPGEMEQVYINPTQFSLEVGQRYTGDIVCDGGIIGSFEVYA